MIATVSAKPKTNTNHITYPFSIEKDLYNAAQSHSDDEGFTFAQYIRKLIKDDLKAKGLWPLPEQTKP